MKERMRAYFFLPVLNTLLNSIHELLQNSKLISWRRHMCNRMVCKQSGVDSLLNGCISEMFFIWVVEIELNLKVLTTETIELPLSFEQYLTLHPH